MNPIQNDTNARGHMASRGSKESYGKPTVTTFGLVAKLTMTGGSEMRNDSKMATRHHPPS
jgi:hypothetical protein